MMDTDNLPV